jgi:hypothetical protein
MRFQVLFSGAALALTIATVAGAQTPPPSSPAPPSPRVACRPSAMSLCAIEVKARDCAGVRACLIKNFDKVTPDCQAAMKAAKARGETPADSAPPPKP